MEMSIPIALIIGAAIGAIPAIWTCYSNRKQRRADVMLKITQAAEGIVEQLDKRVKDLEAENTKLQTENIELRIMLEALEVKVSIIQRARARQNAGIDILLTQMAAEGVTPVWKPVPRDKELRVDDKP